jgi:hypothetical protein
MANVGPAKTSIIFVATTVQPAAFVAVTEYVVVVVGATIIEAVVSAESHKYEAKPAVAVKFAAWPESTFASFAVQELSVEVTANVGAATTVTVFEAVEVQPFASVADTEYVAVAVGLTEIEAVNPPLDHEYAAKPAVAAKFAVWPDKTFESFAAQELSVSVIEAVVGATIVTINEAVEVQPSAFVAVTEYVEVAVGLTEIVAVEAAFDQI